MGKDLTSNVMRKMTVGIWYMTPEAQIGVLWLPRGVGWGGRWEGGPQGGDICIPMTDSCWYMAETNTIL